MGFLTDSSNNASVQTINTNTNTFHIFHSVQIAPRYLRPGHAFYKTNAKILNLVSRSVLTQKYCYRQMEPYNYMMSLASSWTFALCMVLNKLMRGTERWCAQVAGIEVLYIRRRNTTANDRIPRVKKATSKTLVMKQVLMSKKKRQDMHIQRNTEARSCNHCRSGIAFSTTYSDCVSLALGTQHEKRMRPIILSSEAYPAVPHFLDIIP
jgi:hypothetical protein